MNWYCCPRLPGTSADPIAAIASGELYSCLTMRPGSAMFTICITKTFTDIYRRTGSWEGPAAGLTTLSETETAFAPWLPQAFAAKQSFNLSRDHCCFVMLLDERCRVVGS